jgi:cellulose biosynthesis protein BcsQ
VETVNEPGRIITFYSYKGGTGRSMALANVAWLLATAGKRVLMIDWDLEAPGLHRYVHPFLDDPELTSSEGVIDFVISYTEEASSQKLDAHLDPKWFASYANITRFAVPLDYEFPGEGALDFIPAGKQGAAYAGRVNSFNWRDFYIHLGGRAVLDEATARMREYYDFILIDSRTGVSDTSGICTVQMPDAVVICFTLNMQSVTGAAAAAHSMQQQRAKDPLQLFPVAMRLEAAEKIKTDLIREYAKRKFLPFMSDAAIDPAARDQYFHDVEVPHIPFYAFEEQLAYFLDSPNQLTGILGSMKRLVWLLTKVDVRGAEGPDPSTRAKVLAEYAGVWGRMQEAPPLSFGFFITYSSVDGKDFALKLADHLAAGPPAIDVWIDQRNLLPGEDWDEQIAQAIKTCKGMLFVMSQDSVRADSVCKDEWIMALRYKKPVIPLLLDRDAELPFRLASREYVDCTGPFDLAVARLRKHLAWLDSPEGQLQNLKYQLSDAQRELSRAEPDRRDSVMQEIEDLKRQIAQQQR